jgi:hypothetical protein
MDAKVRLIADIAVYMHGDDPFGLQVLLQTATEVESFGEFGFSGSPYIDYFEPIHFYFFLSIEQVSNQMF